MKSSKFLNKKYEAHKHEFVFGATTATIVNLGLISSLGLGSNPRLSIVAGILVVALADNLTDSLSIHIYQEAEAAKGRSVWLSTFSNFFTRFFVSLLFVAIVLFFPLPAAIVVSIVLGMAILSAISYLIARRRKENPILAIAEHLLIASAVVVLSYSLSRIIVKFIS